MSYLFHKIFWLLASNQFSEGVTVGCVVKITVIYLKRNFFIISDSETSCIAITDLCHDESNSLELMWCFMFRLLQVIPFPMSCDVRGDCACRDPDAQENNKGFRYRSIGWASNPRWYLGLMGNHSSTCCLSEGLSTHTTLQHTSHHALVSSSNNNLWGYDTWPKKKQKTNDQTHQQ